MTSSEFKELPAGVLIHMQNAPPSAPTKYFVVLYCTIQGLVLTYIYV
jgi:hypothetical protein